MFVSPLKIIQDPKCFFIDSIQTSEKQMNMCKKKNVKFFLHIFLLKLGLSTSCLSRFNLNRFISLYRRIGLVC